MSGRPTVGVLALQGDVREHFAALEHCDAKPVAVRRESELRSWGLALRKRLGFKRATVALARKLAVIMHAMLKTGTDFNPTPAARP